MKVAVIGAGTMGSGIAQACAQSDGYEVILTDISLEFAQKGQQRELLTDCRAGLTVERWNKKQQTRSMPA